MTEHRSELDEAIALLQTAVKYSNIPGQKHIDLSLVNAPDLPKFQNALKITNTAVLKGEITREQLMARLNL